MELLLANGRLLNPLFGTDGKYDILICDGIVKAIEKKIHPSPAFTIMDCTGLWISPGFIDVHVHLRDPGFLHKEDIFTGTQSGAAGGYTGICPMPNTKPVTDNPEIIDYILSKNQNFIDIYPIAAITKNQEGVELTDIQTLAQNGVRGISEDGKSVMNAKLMKKAMEQAAIANIPVFSHCEDIDLVDFGAMHKGEFSKALGILGIDPDAENIITGRDILLAESTGCALHLCHMSTKKSVDLLDQAKEKGLKVTGEACPHHFIFTDETVSLQNKNTNTKMNPPLREQEDKEKIIQGLQKGIIDIIASDHAPHTLNEKSAEYHNAPFGITGLETNLSLSLTYLVHENILTPLELIEKMSLNPAKLLQVDKGYIQVGKEFDAVIIDPEKIHTIDAHKHFSKGKNTPFQGMEVRGKVETTFKNGIIIYHQGKIYDPRSDAVENKL